MFEKIIKIFKKIVFSFFLLYSYNVFSVHFDMIVPINILNIMIISFFGVSGLFCLIGLLKFMI